MYSIYIYCVNIFVCLFLSLLSFPLLSSVCISDFSCMCMYVYVCVYMLLESYLSCFHSSGPAVTDHLQRICSGAHNGNDQEGDAKGIYMYNIHVHCTYPYTCMHRGVYF